MKLKFSFLLFCILFINLKSQASVVDSLKNCLAKTNNPSEQLVLLQQLSNEYVYSDNAKTKESATKMLHLARKLKNRNKEASALSLLGNYYYQIGVYERTISLFSKAISIQKQTHNRNDLADSYSSMGNVYESMGNTKNALKYYLLALKLDSGIGNKARLSDDYTNLGIFYLHIDQHKKALAYYRKAFAIDQKLGDGRRLAESYINLGSVHYNLMNMDSSVFYMEQGKALSEKLGLTTAYARSLNNLASLYFEKGDLKRALDELISSREIKVKAGDQEGLTIADLNLAGVYLALNDFDKALYHANLSKQVAEKIKYSEGMADANMQLSEIYSNKGDFKKALEYFKEYTRITKERLNEESVQQVAEMNVKYETEKKEQRIQLFKKEDANKKLKIDRQNTQIFLLILSILFVFALFLILYMRYRQKQKRLLAKHLLEEQTLRYSSVVEAQEQEKMRMAQDLHDGICQKFAATKMHFSLLQENVKNTLPEKLESYNNCIQLLDDATNELRSVAHEIMPPALRQHDLMGALEQLADSTFATSPISYSFELLGIPLELDALQEINLYRVTQELFANVLKHSKAKNVSIQLLSSRERLLLHVEDDGIGIANIKESGIGLSNIQLRAQSMKATFSINPGPINGAIATLFIPIYNIDSIAS